MKWLSLTIMLLLLTNACADKKSQPVDPAEAIPSVMTISSPDFAPGDTIPSTYTCQGDDSSPSLKWSDPPQGTKSLALIMEDPDAPMGTWVHWLVYNIPPDTDELLEGASKANMTEFLLPDGALQGRTSSKRSDYGGPCPPSGTHHYFFRLYALDIILNQPDLSKNELLDAIQNHVLAAGELMGTFKKE
jgi:Raf kinase inhibitor-like YbhB/YbcL family protein